MEITQEIWKWGIRLGKETIYESTRLLQGLISIPLLTNSPLTDWTMVGLPFEDVSWAYNMSSIEEKITPPAVYVGKLVLPPERKPLDTYVDLTGWGKVVYLLGFNYSTYNSCVLHRYFLLIPIFISGRYICERSQSWSLLAIGRAASHPLRTGMLPTTSSTRERRNRIWNPVCSTQSEYCIHQQTRRR